MSLKSPKKKKKEEKEKKNRLRLPVERRDYKYEVAFKTGEKSK